MPQLDPTWFASQLFWLAITFAALYFMLSRFVLPPLQDVIARRAQTVENDVNTAQSLKSQADTARADYERALAESRSKAQTLMSDAMAELKAAGEQKTREMDKKIESSLQDATRRIAAKKDEMIAALSPTASELTSMIVEKLTQAKPTGDQVGRIIGELSKGRR